MRRYWVCIIEVDKAKLPYGFDSVPRFSAIDAIEKRGIKVTNCWSGWEADKECVDDIMYEWNRPREVK